MVALTGDCMKRVQSERWLVQMHIQMALMMMQRCGSVVAFAGDCMMFDQSVWWLVQTHAQPAWKMF